MDGDFDRQFDQLPAKIRVLSLQGRYNQQLPVSMFSLKYLEEIYFGEFFNQEIKTSCLPKRSLKKLDFVKYGKSCCFNQSLAHLPLSLRWLRLCSSYKRSLSHLPSNLEYLKIGSKLTSHIVESLDMLPVMLQELNMKDLKIADYTFKSFPSYLKKLVLPTQYDRDLPQLPSKLEEIQFGECYNQRIKSFPVALTKISFGHMYDQELPPLPPRLEYLSFHSADTSSRSQFNQVISEYPPTLAHLRLSDQYTQTLNTLPQSLQYLYVGREFNDSITSLPSHLVELKFHKDSKYNKPLPPLPESLKTLILGNSFNEPLPPILPQSLKKLHTGRAFSHQRNNLSPSVHYTN